MKSRHVSKGLLSGLCTLAAILAGVTAFSCTARQQRENAENTIHRKILAIEGELTAALEKAERAAGRLSSEIEALYPDIERNAAFANAGDYRVTATGIMYRRHAIERQVPSVFVSGIIPVDEPLRRIVLGTEAMDAALITVVKTQEEIAQSYYNDRHSYNRLFPPVNVIAQFPAGMDIPSYNFYYLADAAHNPSRKPVWIGDPYVDPAGRGWVISCISPVYHDDVLEGVSGIDFTIDTIVRTLNLEDLNDLSLLMTDDGMVVASGESMSRIFRLPLKAKHRYVDTVRCDTPKPDSHNLLKSPSSDVREQVCAMLVRKGAPQIVEIDGLKLLIAGRHLPKLDWWIVCVAPIP